MAAGKKTGGRQAGTPNKATRGFLEAQAELQSLFDAALSEPHFDEKKNVKTGKVTLIASGLTKLQAFIRTQVNRAIEGDAEAARIVMDRWAGRPKQQLEGTGKDGKMEMVVTLVGERAKPTD